MGRFPGETSCLSLVWAVLDLFFSHASNGATFTDVDRQHLYPIKYQQADPDTLDEDVTAAQTQPREPKLASDLQHSWDATQRRERPPVRHEQGPAEWAVRSVKLRQVLARSSQSS